MGRPFGTWTELDVQRMHFLSRNSYVPGLTSDERQEFDVLEHRQFVATVFGNASPAEQEYVRLSHASPWSEEDATRLAELRALDAAHKAQESMAPPAFTADECIEAFKLPPWKLELLMLESKWRLRTDKGRKTKQAELAEL